MKIVIGNYRSHWYSPYIILEKFFYWRKDYDPYKTEPPKWLQTLCEWNQKFLDTVHPRIQYIKIDRWDTWSMDCSMSLILLPMFKQLKATKHGAPYTHDEHVPDYLKSMSAPRCENEWDTDDNHFLRWEYILDEIIWALSQSNIDWQDQYKSGVSDTDWVESDYQYDGENTWEVIHGPKHTLKYDWDGMELHQERMTNGFRLMGAYWQGFWD